MIIDKCKGDILSYCKLEQDNDYNHYYFMRQDVVSYSYKDNQINDLITKWKQKLVSEDDDLFIKRNYLFFTYNNQKFYIKLSHFTSEWRLIDKIIDDFSKLTDNVCYIFGELD